MGIPQSITVPNSGDHECVNNGMVCASDEKYGHAQVRSPPFDCRSMPKRARNVSKMRAGASEPLEHSSSLTIDELTVLLRRVQKNEIDVPESRVR